METRYLRSFLKIAETGSITRAADSLGISQPSLSQQLLRLEDEVGVSLFSRTARGVTLTEPGRRFLSHARSIIEGVNSACEDIRLSGEDAVGEVILAAPYSISRLAGARISHILGQSLIRVEGDKANAETFFLGLMRLKPDDQGVSRLNQLAGRFVDELVRIDGTWKIRHRTCVRDTSLTLRVEEDMQAGYGLAQGTRDGADPGAALLALAHRFD